MGVTSIPYIVESHVVITIGSGHKKSGVMITTARLRSWSTMVAYAVMT